jgi:hydrogenase expression/formation protein HypE
MNEQPHEGAAAMPATIDPLQVTCPSPHAENERVLLGHGAGGRLSAQLLRDLIVPALGPAAADICLDDAALLDFGGDAIAEGGAVLTTDSFVVDPLEFPGGDIGALAVHGTVNDLAMRGAQPVALAVALIVEEGFALADLRRIVASVGRAASSVGVPVVTGDTKVVGRGCADKLFITTTGFGRRAPEALCSASSIRPGDAVILSGPIGLHGVTVLATRENLGFDADPDLRSDTRPLHRLVQTMLDVGGAHVHALRDPTRGGLASALNELAASSDVGIVIDESALPIPRVVAAACEILGLDPLHVANEGCCVAFIASGSADAVLAAMRASPDGVDAVRIGEAHADHRGRVSMRTLLGAHRIVDMLVGEQLPRIC